MPPWAGTPSKLGGKEILILSTHGGVRAPDGTPIALGLHTGHWEVGLLVEAAAEELKKLGAIPFATSCSDPCDGRTQGTAGMFDSLPFRNDAATIFRRQIRSLPRRSGVLGVAACDKGVPAMMMALAAMHELPSVLVPGGVMLPAEDGWNASSVQSIGPQYLHGQITLEEAASAGCHSCASPGGGCQFLGTAATSQVVAEALGMALTHAALAPSGQPIWMDMARRSARAVMALEARGLRMRDILSEASIHNALVTHAAFGGSTNLILHMAAVAHAAGLRRPGRADWARVNAQVPRLVDVLPNGPRNHPTVQVFLAGGVPEVMLHLRRAGLLETGAMTASGQTLGAMLDWWEKSERRARLRALLQERDGVDPDDVIMDPETARKRGITSTVCFPTGNLAPEGSVIKSTAIDPSVVDADGVFRKVGPARVFFTEAAVIAAIKSSGEDRIRAGDVIVLAGRGPLGAGMEEALPAHGGAQVPGLRKARRVDHRFQVQRRIDGRVHRPRFARSAGGRSARQSARRRHHRDHRGPEPAGRLGEHRRLWRAAIRRRRGRAVAGLAATAPGPGAGCAAAGRHAPVGGVAGGERRPLGRLCVRCG